MVTGGLTLLLLGIRESRPSMALAKEVAKLRKATQIKTLEGLNPDETPDWQTFVRIALFRPARLFFTELIVFIVSIMSAIAIVATLNGIVIQVILASRVLYGLGRQGQLPAVFAEVNPKSRTPLFATTLTTAFVLVFAFSHKIHSCFSSNF